MINVDLYKPCYDECLNGKLSISTFFMRRWNCDDFNLSFGVEGYNDLYISVTRIHTKERYFSFKINGEWYHRNLNMDYFSYFQFLRMIVDLKNGVRPSVVFGKYLFIGSTVK